jgi:hypothetical protein
MSADLQRLGRRLVGRWSSEAIHPAIPATALLGSSEFEWLDGERFVIFRSHCEHPDIPDAISIIGDTDGLRMHYSHARGVHRLFEVTVTDDGWTITMARDAAAASFASSDAPFSQRVTYIFEDDHQVMSAKVELSYDDITWYGDLVGTYTRVA